MAPGICHNPHHRSPHPTLSLPLLSQEQQLPKIWQTRLHSRLLLALQPRVLTSDLPVAGHLQGHQSMRVMQRLHPRHHYHPSILLPARFVARSFAQLLLLVQEPPPHH